MQVVYTLQQQAKVEPGFTQLVWQKLEEQNPDFFKAYYTRLKLKDQIVLFNHLLEQQVAMFQKMQRQWMAPTGKLCCRVFPPSRRSSFELLKPSGKGTLEQHINLCPAVLAEDAKWEELWWGSLVDADAFGAWSEQGESAC